jgi:hypothetical protein
MSAHIPIRRQKPVRGGRDRQGACVDPAVTAFIEREAHRYNVSKSFVANTIFGRALGHVSEDYRSNTKLRRVK